MTLSSPFELVKRHRKEAVIALAVALVTVGGMFFIWHDPVANETRAHTLGVSLSKTLATQGMEAMLQPDRLHLSVLTNRMASLPDVAYASYFGANDEPIAESGKAPPSPRFQYTEPVVIGNTISGFARVSLRENAFAPNISGRQVAATLLLVLLLPLATIALRELTSRSRSAVPIVEFPEDVGDPPGPRWLVIVNLYNQLAFASGDRKALVGRTRKTAEDVALLYGGHAEFITGSGVMMQFTQDSDTAFQAICASFLLADLLTQSEPDAEFRFALHYEPQADSRPPSAELIADAALLAALARENTLMVTQDFFNTLKKRERVSWEPYAHPMLEDIPFAREETRQICDLAETHRRLLSQQATLLLESMTGDDAGHSAAV